MIRSSIALAAFITCACGALPSPSDAGFDAGVRIQTDGGFDLNDVSFLFPLPANVLDRQLLTPTSSGNNGQLLPRDLFDVAAADVPLIVNHLTDVYPELSVIAVRVDPCFDFDGTGCMHQIRLVLQPIEVDDRVQVIALDGAVHLFYELSPQAWGRVVGGLAELRGLAQGQTAGQPLSVHPVMRVEGANGPYATRLKKLVLDECGENNLIRIAMMGLQAPDQAWLFGTQDLQRPSGGQVVFARLQIPRLDDGVFQQQVNEVGGESSHSGNMNPAPELSPFNSFLNDIAVSQQAEGQIHDGFVEAARLENPTLLNPRTADCASCHVATRARLSVEALRPNLVPASLAERYLPDPRFDVRQPNANPRDGHVQRAFGYFGSAPVVSLRTIFESAEIAGHL